MRRQNQLTADPAARRILKLATWQSSGPSRHGAKTSLTLWREDMADTFHLMEVCFCGHAVEYQNSWEPALGFYQSSAQKAQVLQLAVSVLPSVQRRLALSHPPQHAVV